MNARKEAYREVLGERLRAFRVERGLSVYAVAKKGGLRIDQVQAVESGKSNYTVDIFLSYVSGCDLYMFFSEKSEGRAEPHDFEDLIRKGLENDPGL